MHRLVLVFFGGVVLGRGATSHGGALLLLDIDKGEGHGLLKLWCHWSLSGRMSAVGRFAKLAHLPKADIGCPCQERMLRTSDRVVRRPSPDGLSLPPR